MRPVLLDTDILSYILENRHPDVAQTAAQYLRVFRFFSISAITVAEVLEGFESVQNYEGAASFRRFISDFEVVPIEVEEADLAGQILGALVRTGQKIGDLDPFIAATAIQRKCPLVTHNLGHFRRIVDLGFNLELEDWRTS